MLDKLCAGNIQRCSKSPEDGPGRHMRYSWSFMSHFVDALEALLSGLAKFDVADPFRLEDFAGCEASFRTRVRIEDGVDDVAATSLMGNGQHQCPHTIG